MQKNKVIIVASHLIIWLTLFYLPYLLSYGEQQDINRLIAHFWVPLFFSSIVFYVNYFKLIDRFLFLKKTLWFILINALMISFFLFMKEYIEDNFIQIIKKRADGSLRTGPPIKMAIYMQLLSYLAPVLFSIAIKTTQRWSKIEAERKEATNIKLKSELQHLHYQLQPHFFFNALNNIYSMIDFSPEQSKKAIHSLSKLMRYMLYETNLEFVPLSKEIDFMKKYIELMKLRVSDKTKVISSFPSDETGIQIAPLLFISLVENAFKHGVSATKESTIQIVLACNGDKVKLTIENDNFPKNTEDKSGSGIGIKNLEKRLQLLYPNAYQFKQTIENDRFLVVLNIETK